MANDSEKTRLLLLAKEKLKIDKNDRLIGGDGFRYIPEVPELFYINELITWLTNSIKPNQENKIRTGKYSYDSTIESIGYEKVNAIPDSWSAAPGIYKSAKIDKLVLAEVYAPLSNGQILAPELKLRELNKYSHSHQVFLHKMLYSLNKHSTTFLTRLAENLGRPISSEDYYADSLNILRWLETKLLNFEMDASFKIPELYGLRDHGILMSFSLDEVFKYEYEEWGLLYTYRFSEQTSYSFLKLLKDFISTLIRRNEKLEMQQRKNKSSSHAPDKVDSDLIRRPTDTKDKVKLILELLGSSEETSSNYEGELDNITLMILMAVFCKQKVFNPNIKKWRMGIAHHILTGYSYSKFDRDFQMDDLDVKTLRKITDTGTSKAYRTALSRLVNKFEKDLIPYLNKLKVQET